MLVLPAELTHAQAQASLLLLQKALRAETGSAIVADAHALQQFDSSALAVLLECRREALSGGKTLSVQALPPRLRQLATLYGVAEFLPAAA